MRIIPDAIADALAQRREMLQEVDAIRLDIGTILQQARAGGLDDDPEFDELLARVATVGAAIRGEIQTLLAMPPRRISVDEAIEIVACWLDVLTACAALESEITMRTAGHFSEGEIAALLDAYRVQSAAWRRETLEDLSTQLVAFAAEPW